MPRREWELRIKDILVAISAVQAYTEGMKYEAFVTDRRTVDAVIRNLIVIGWRDMADMRNFVVHEYFGVSDKIIWDTVQKDLPPLIPVLEGLLRSKAP